MLELDETQTDKVNKILKDSYTEYLKVELQHVEQQTVDNRHVIITIKPHAEAVAKLEDRLWSQLDAVLDSEQQRIARLNLHLDPPEIAPGADLSKPALFGWSKYGAKIEIWRVGAWYHWKVETRNFAYEMQAPELPVEFRRFWKEPDH